MLITRTTRIDMGHRVPNHKSKCKHLHGHSYTIELGVDDKVIIDKGSSDEGMVIDFGDLKNILKSEVEDQFDHKFVLSDDDIEVIYAFGHELMRKALGIIQVNFVPTAENLAKHWYELCKVKLLEKKIKIKHVKVWETPLSTAQYEE